MGVALAVAQIGWRFWRGEPVDALQWISLITVVAGSTATLVTHDARFVMLKPTIIYGLVGITMLRRGWLNRYMPDRAREYVPDLIIVSGYVWAGFMFLSAALNILLALTSDVLLWGALMTIWGFASKTALFLGQFAIMKTIGKRRGRERTAAAMP